MRSSTRCRRWLLRIPVLGLCFTIGPVVAQEAPLGEVDLPPSAIVVALSDATVRITAVDTTEPELRWRRQSSDEPGSVELLATQDGDAVVIERLLQEEGETLAPLVIDIIMPTDRAIAVIGADLDLSIQRKTGEPVLDLEVETEPQPVVGEPAIVELDVANSELTLVGVGPVVGSMVDSVAELLQTTGTHDLRARDSRLQIAAHSGPATVFGEGSEIIAEETMGKLSFKARGGSVELRSTQGQFKLEIFSAYLQVLGCRGSGTLSVNDSDADIRETTLQSLNIKGISGRVNLSGTTAAITTDLTGGSLTTGSVNGNITGTLRDGARADISDHRGEIKLNIQNDSAADLTGIRGDVNLSGRAANLTVDGAKTLTFTAVDSYATLRSITKLASFKAIRSEVEIDLHQCRDRSLKMDIQTDSSVRVELATPCRVVAKGLGSSLASQVDVTGCELQLGRAGKSPTRRIRGVDGQTPVGLSVTVAETAQLRVVGRP